MPLKLQVDRAQAGLPRMFLHGSLDESAPIEEVLKGIDEDAVLNLSNIQRVNSIGLLKWVRAIQPLTQRRKVQIEAISYALALQAAQVSDLFGGATVTSCLAPYFCASCKTEAQVEVTADEVKSAAAGVPDKRCPTCGGPLQFDDIQQFFSFLLPVDEAR